MLLRVGILSKYWSWYSVKELALNMKFCQTIMTVMPNALKLFYDFCGNYARRDILDVDVYGKGNFVIRIDVTLQQYICTKNDEELSGRHEDNY